MRVFVTGATGFIGTRVVAELIGAGHSVVGLSRSEDGVARLRAAGAAALLGVVEDVEVLKAGAADAEGVIHLAFNHDFTKMAEHAETDRRAIEAMGGVLAGSARPFVVTSGTAIANTVPGQKAVEDGQIIGSGTFPRAASEEAAGKVAADGANVSIVRLPQVHDPEKQGLLTFTIALWREKGVCAYVGDGENRWPAAHVSDVARLYRLAVERAASGAKYHAVAEEGVTLRAMAEAVAKRLGMKADSVSAEEAQAFFGPFAMFAGRDMPASSKQTRAVLDWAPSGPTMLEDLARLKV